MKIDELQVGQQAESLRIIRAEHIQSFADLSGDHNPVHFDRDYASKTMFKDVIAHGMLSASFISAIVGTVMPGEGTIYLGQTLKFLAPVRIGDQVRTVVTVKAITKEKRRVVCDTSCFVGATKVIEGDATLMVPV
jgi:3-hydroxybutyryl-CoA dehydratase